MTGPRKALLTVAIVGAIALLTTVAQANIASTSQQYGSPPTINTTIMTADEALATNVHVISDVVAATQTNESTYGQVTTVTRHERLGYVATTIERMNEQGTYLALNGTVTATNYVAKNVATRSLDMATDQLGK